MHDKADFTLDLRGTFSPLSLLKVSRVFTEMKVHQIMDILGCDTATQTDLFKVLPRDAFDVLPIAEAGGQKDPSRVRLQKRQ